MDYMNAAMARLEGVVKSLRHTQERINMEYDSANTLLNTLPIKRSTFIAVEDTTARTIQIGWEKVTIKNEWSIVFYTVEGSESTMQKYSEVDDELRHKAHLHLAILVNNICDEIEKLIRKE